MLSYRVLRAIAKKQGLKKLTIRNCEINSKNRKNEEQTQACNSLFEKSSLEVLDLAYYHLPSGKGRPVNPFFARLAFIPSLEIMNTTTISFRAIGNLSDMPAIPKLKVLRIVPTFHEAPLVQRLHLSSFLSRCSQLESLYIDERIRLDEDNDEDEEEERAAQMPELQTYEGPSWPLSLLRAPRLQRVVVTRLRWDEGALINALASMSSNLKTLVVELAVTLDDPRMKVIDAIVLRLTNLSPELGRLGDGKTNPENG
ncbi:hypothetical protein FRB90_001029 [Tulasnella sp. 427]|nr:hypothetical protein FRB90_001029 [Tulasnella sp. 427]